MRFSGRRLIITGAGGGIGSACARLAGAEGANVALAGPRREVLDELASGWSDPGRVLTEACDVTREEDVRRLFDRAVEHWGGVDLLVNCAAVFHKAPFAELALADWERVLAVNLTGTFLCCREAFRRFKPGSAVVNVSSLSGTPGVEKFPGFAAYNASKYGVLGLTEILAVEGNPLGIRVNSVSPAAVATPMLRAAAPDLPPAMQAEDAARAILSLLSDDCRAVTGANLILNGPPPTPALGGLR